MQLDDIVKYLPTSTVGKIVETREQDGKVWAKLDYTKLWYDASLLTPCDPSEYKTVSVKYREVKELKREDLLSDIHREDADSTELTFTG